jgi:hypothetical protein
MRGAGDIFQGLFRRPFGEPAFDAWVAQRRAEPEAAFALTGEAAAPAATSGRQMAADLDADEPPVRPGFYAVVRGGAMQAWLRGTQGVGHVPNGSAGPSLTIAAGRQLNTWLAAELEGGYQRPGGVTQTFGYPAVGYPGPAIADTSYQFAFVPLTVNVRVQVPSARARPYLILGGGVTFFNATMDPPDFNATVRVARNMAFAQAGLGLVADLGTRLFLGVEARAFATTDVSFLNGTIGFHGGNATLLLGAKL